MSTFTLTCGWCKSKDQTADIVHGHVHSHRDHAGNDRESYRFVGLCRRCKRYSSITADLTYPLPSVIQVIMAGGKDIFAISLDITSAFKSDYRQTPAVSSQIPAEIPNSVKESLLDADQARSPRARCQSYRSAIEFALREAGISTKPGATLGALLSDAKANFAISDPLIELCDQVKAFGNWGMHWSESDITENDADAARDITIAIVDYLFAMPARVAKARSRTDEAKSAHKAGKKVVK